MFFWNSLAFSMIQWMLASWSLVPLPFLNPAWAFGSSWFAWCGSLACKILSMTLLAWEMSAIVWWLAHSLVLPFFGIGRNVKCYSRHWCSSFWGLNVKVWRERWWWCIFIIDKCCKNIRPGNGIQNDTRGQVDHFRQDHHEEIMIKKNVLKKHQLTQELNKKK